MTCGAKDSHTQQLWVNALYRATGQTTRPEKSDNIRGNDVNDIRKAGLDMLISKEPCKLDQVRDIGDYHLCCTFLSLICN